eukprot:scaffold795_cov113-Cylindrotheca_fusiformis.AAC.4
MKVETASWDTHTNPGTWEEPLFWKDWIGRCDKCQKLIRNGGGVFCGNFANARGIFNPCQKVWCAKCYSVPDGSEFPIRRPVDEDGLENLAPGDEWSANSVILGTFNDEILLIRRVGTDVTMMTDIRRASLDAFWSREPSTVSANLYQSRRNENYGRLRYGMDSVAPRLGPFPLEDTFGMKPALIMLARSLDPGKTEGTVQFATVRKVRSAFSNNYHASQELSGLAAMAYETTKMYSTACPTYGYWFDRFVAGCHKRMGDATVTDRALSKLIYWELLKDLERDWNACTTHEQRFQVAEFANLLNFLYLTGLRGEEGMKIDVAGFLKYLDAGFVHPTHPHVVLPLLGRLKGEQGERYHLVFMVRVTRSGVQAGDWADRFGQLVAFHKGWRNGWLFRRPDGEQAKIGSFDAEFTARLMRVQEAQPDLFEPNLVVGDAYGLRRSPRRGSTSEASNSGVRREVIELNNRWRKFERAKGRDPALSMAAHYTDVKLMVESFLEYSHSF